MQTLQELLCPTRQPEDLLQDVQDSRKLLQHLFFNQAQILCFQLEQSPFIPMLVFVSSDVQQVQVEKPARGLDGRQKMEGSVSLEQQAAANNNSC